MSKSSRLVPETEYAVTGKNYGCVMTFVRITRPGMSLMYETYEQIDPMTGIKSQHKRYRHVAVQLIQLPEAEVEGNPSSVQRSDLEGAG